MNRGEILSRGTFRLPDKRRPILILTQSEVIDQLNEIISVPSRGVRATTSRCHLSFRMWTIIQVTLCGFSDTPSKLSMGG